MSLGRRDLLKLSAFVAAAPLAATAQESDPPAADAASLATDWAAVRAQFRLDPAIIDMSAMLLASHPAPVRAAIERHRDGLDANTVAYIESNNDDLQLSAREAAGEYLGIHRSHVALTDSTTGSVGLVYGGLVLAPGDEIVITDRDYYVTHESARLAALRSGAALRVIELVEDAATASAAQLADAVVAGVGPSTRILGLTWVHSSTGLKLPIAAIAARLAEINQWRDAGHEVLLCLDGVHGFGVEDVSFAELGCDFLMAGCHKWLFGPRGTGIIAVSDCGLDSINPVVPSFVSERSFAAWIEQREPQGAIDADSLNPGGFKAFEHVWSLPEAFGFVAAIGKARIAARTHELATQLKQGLLGVDGLVLRTPLSAELSAGIVAFDVEGWNPYGVVRRLRQQRIVASVAPYASQHVRLTPSIRNTPDEVENVVAALRTLVG